VAVVDGFNTATPQTWYVAVDHVHRPIRMTNAAPFVARLRQDGRHVVRDVDARAPIRLSSPVARA